MAHSASHIPLLVRHFAVVVLLATVAVNVVSAELTSFGADDLMPSITNDTIIVTGRDGRVRSHVKGVDPCHSDPNGPKLECVLFTLCVPGTTKLHENGLVYRGENELNECSIFDDACCVLDPVRLEKFIAEPNDIVEIAKKARL